MALYDRGRLRLDRLGRNRAGAAIVRRRPCRLCIAKQNSRARPVLRFRCGLAGAPPVAPVP
ncbi:hypothetical protein [Sphingobium sp. MK2]|uniref:hypothetical protein n=1 Tax=Sphingobium sp. MK2 TaxID=3116540 RepID=UPI0032E360AF